MTIHVRTQQEEPSFIELQELVGGYFTLISVSVEDTPALMYVNEVGEITGLPLNLRASQLAGFEIFGDTVLWVHEGLPVL